MASGMGQVSQQQKVLGWLRLVEGGLEAGPGAACPEELGFIWQGSPHWYVGEMLGKTWARKVCTKVDGRMVLIR